MKIKILVLTLTFVSMFFLNINAAPNEKTLSVKVDFQMIEKGINWLEYLQKVSSPEKRKAWFMKHVAPTAGCRSIIHHWERFMEWNVDIFYDFIIEAIEATPKHPKYYKKNGSLSIFGRRSELWKQALKNIDIIKRRLEILKSINFKNTAIKKALENLPMGTELKVNIYFVLFGHSSAFAVKNENGFDLLQLELEKSPESSKIELVESLAHELHHSGFKYWSDKNLSKLKKTERILLTGILTSEGSATYLIDKPFLKLKSYKKQPGSLNFDIATDWEKHSKKLPLLYKKANTNLQKNLSGQLNKKDIVNFWLSGVKGAAYVLGSDICRVIETYLGKKSLMKAIKDYRMLIPIYNKAALAAKKKGKSLFLFSPDLVEKLIKFDQ